MKEGKNRGSPKKITLLVVFLVLHWSHCGRGALLFCGGLAVVEVNNILKLSYKELQAAAAPYFFYFPIYCLKGAGVFRSADTGRGQKP